MSTKIDWADETLNPQGWGCYGPGGTPANPLPCPYCYARRFATRNTRGCAKCAEFTPHWHPEQLEKPLRWKKGRKIFWQSMGDLFHPCTLQNQILAVKDMAKVTPQHIHIFLTKNPKRLKDFNLWPPNCWVGTTVTNQADVNAGRICDLLQADAPVRFVSHEPLLSEIKLRKTWVTSDPEWAPAWKFGHINWAILGAMTGPGAVKPKPKWVSDLIDQYRAAGVPIFVKDSLYKDFPIREWPKCPNPFSRQF